MTAGFFLTYLVCIPLGVLKAIRHRTIVDSFSSILIFMGYAIPGYALGSLLLLYFSVRLEWFPMSGFVSIQFAELSPFEKVSDLISHSVLPLICYLVGSFALVPSESPAGELPVCGGAGVGFGTAATLDRTGVGVGVADGVASETTTLTRPLNDSQWKPIPTLHAK